MTLAPTFLHIYIHKRTGESKWEHPTLPTTAPCAIMYHPETDTEKGERMYIFTKPLLWVPALYVLAAVLPAAFLLYYVYRQDRVEREPVGLLMSLLWKGVLAALCAIVLETLGQLLLDRLCTPGTFLHTVLLAFVVVAGAEEGMKLFFLKRRTWYDYQFNYRFDAIVYAVFVSLGFAAFENIQYVFTYGLSVALPRALLSIPGHMAFAVYMGVFYGRAKLRENRGNHAAARSDLMMAYFSAVLLHGFYDACAMVGAAKASVLFIAFVVVVYWRMIRLLKWEAAQDAPV